MRTIQTRSIIYSDHSMECQIKWHPHQFGIQSIKIWLLLLHTKIQRRPHNITHLGGWLLIDLRLRWTQWLDWNQIKQTFQSQIFRTAIYYYWSQGSSGRPFDWNLPNSLHWHTAQEIWTTGWKPSIYTHEPKYKIRCSGMQSIRRQQRSTINKPWLCKFDQISYVPRYRHTTWYSIFGQQYMLAPKAKHWTAVKRIFRYLKGTRQLKLTYGGSPELYHEEINIYCDANWASDSDQILISGYVIIIAGGAIAWSSKKQNRVAPSTPKAEYIAAKHVTKQVLWHWLLLTKLEFYWQLHQLYFQTTNWQLWSPIIPSSMHAPNILTLHYIFYGITWTKELSTCFISRLTTT